MTCPYLSRHWFSLAVLVAVAVSFSGFRTVANRLASPIGLSTKVPIWLVARVNDAGVAEDAMSWAAFNRLQEIMPEDTVTCDGMPLWDLQVSVGNRSVNAQNGRTVCSNFFSFLNEFPALGRTLNEADATSADPVVVLSRSLWLRLGADPNVIGSHASIGETNAVVVGVLNSSFAGVGTLDEGFWLGLATTPTAVGLPRSMFFGANDSDSAVRWIRMMTRDYAAATIAGTGVRATRLVPIQSTAYPGASRPAVSIAVAALRAALMLVVLVAVLNTAVLFHIVVRKRAHERSIRWALGASGLQVWIPILKPTAIAILLGAIMGFALSITQSKLAGRYLGADSLLTESTVGYPDILAVFGVVLAAVFVTAAVVGAPRSADLRRDQAPRSRRWGKALITGQVASAVVLVAVAYDASFFFGRVIKAVPGNNVETLFTFAVVPPTHGSVRPEPRMADSVAERIRAIPGVQGVAYGRPLYGPSIGMTAWEIQADKGRVQLAAPYLVRHVGTGFLEVAETSVREGRNLSSSDGTSSPRVAVVTADFAKSVWGEASIGYVGRTLVLPGEATPATVVGVCDDVARESLWAAPRPTIFVPANQYPDAMPSLDFTMRLKRGANVTPGAIEGAVEDALPGFAVVQYRSVRDVILDEISLQVTFGSLALVVAAFVGILAATGVFVSMAASLEAARVELWMRTVLGASKARAALEVMRVPITCVVAGLAMGGTTAVLLRPYWEIVLLGAAVSFSAEIVAVLVVGSAAALSILIAGATERDHSIQP